MKIKSIWAREILDSRGWPTVEVEVHTQAGCVRASVPSGASTGRFEALEKRDKDNNRYCGRGVLEVVRSINEDLGPRLVGQHVQDQEQIDQQLIGWDATANKSHYGANALLGISLACLKSGALSKSLPVYRYVTKTDKVKVSQIPMMNILNGGVHANNGLDVQEFMIVPTEFDSFKEALRAGAEIFHKLKSILKKQGESVSVGDEGGFAPRLESHRQALECVNEAIEQAHYGGRVKMALDIASSEFLKDGHYHFEGKVTTAFELLEVYEEWVHDFALVSLEDAFGEEDWEAWKHLTQSLGQKIHLVGDDLFVTNHMRFSKGVKEGIANALLVKVNQIGTVTEARKVVQLAQENQYATVMSHRSGETEDCIIADLAVGWGCDYIKMGGISRSERLAKYNQMLRIEEEA